MRGPCCFAFAVFVSTLVAHAAQAQQAVEYGTIDRATVRIFALSNVDVVEVSMTSGTRRTIAIPAAGHGSGVVVSTDGLVLTAAHVVAGARLIAVALPGVDTPLPARVLYADRERDFAFLAIGGDHGFFVTLPEAPPTLHVREVVAAIGYPLDADRADPQSTSGIIAGVLPTGEIQLGISLNPGNSGGPLVNAAEEIVGVVVARVDPRTGAQGIGMAVPLAPILAARRDQVTAHGLLERARAELSSGSATEAPIARAVSMLVRIGLRGIGREVAQLIDARQGELVTLLREIPTDRVSADVSVVRAALLWDALALMLERRGVPTPRELPPDRDRDLALQWERETVASCHAAVRADPEIPRRSPFVAFILRYWPVPVPPPTPAPSVAPPDDRIDPMGTPPTVLHDGRPHWGWYATVSVPQARNETSFEPGGALFGGGFTYVIGENHGAPSVALLTGGDAMLGPWSGAASALVSAVIGFRIGVGRGPRGAAWLHASWVPGISVLEGHPVSLTASALRGSLGMLAGPVALALSWRSVGRQSGASYHALELSAGVGL